MSVQFKMQTFLIGQKLYLFLILLLHKVFLEDINYTVAKSPALLHLCDRLRIVFPLLYHLAGENLINSNS